MTQAQQNNLVIQGRIVWVNGSSLFEGKQKTDYNTNQPIVGADGQPKMEYGFGLAIPKVDPRTGQNSEEYTKVWNALHQEAFTLYPNGQIPPNFAMKFKDGDTVDHNGKPFADREGYVGHIVLTCTTQIPIKYFRFEGGNNILVNDGIKNGDYVNVQMNIKAHPAKGNGNPGLYVNPSAVQLIQPGAEIINSPSGDQMFGQAAPAYNGQVVADTAPQMPNMAAPAPMPGQPPVAAPQAAPVAPVQPQQAPANPHYGVLPTQMQPAPGQVPQPMGNQAPAMPQQQVLAPAQNVPGQLPVQPSNPMMQAPPMPVMPQ